MSATARSIPGVPRLEGWLTLAEAAEVIGITRQAAWVRAARGRFETLRMIAATYVLAEDEARRAAAERTARQATRKPGGLSDRQAETLVGILTGSEDQDYSFFIATGRALERRGLVDNGCLTARGREIAEALIAAASQHGESEPDM